MEYVYASRGSCERVSGTTLADAREAVKALLVAVDFLEAQATQLRAAVSTGYSRGR